MASLWKFPNIRNPSPSIDPKRQGFHSKATHNQGPQFLEAQRSDEGKLAEAHAENVQPKKIGPARSLVITLANGHELGILAGPAVTDHHRGLSDLRAGSKEATPPRPGLER